MLGRPRRLRIHADHIVAGINQGGERGDCEIRRPHKNQTHWESPSGAGFDVCGRVSMDANATSTMACPHTWSYANAEADLASFTVDNLDDTYLQCTFTCAGTPASADLIYVEVRRRTP